MHKKAPLHPQHPSTSPKPLALPISTVLFVPKALTSNENDSTTPSSNIPKSTHWTDCPAPNTFAILQQPPNQSCAVMGDILATRLKVRGVRGAVVDGRVRDLTALKELGAEGEFVVWSRGTSTVGTGMEAKAWAVDVPLRIGMVEVRAVCGFFRYFLLRRGCLMLLW